MSRTGGRWEQKTPFTDGRFVVAPADFTQTSGTASTMTRNAKGDLSLNQGATITAMYMYDIAEMLFRTGQLPFLQEQFGTAANVPGPSSVANTSDPDAGIGPPPQTGILSITPQTGFLPKGIKITDLTLKYLITGAALTLHTIGLSKTVFANNAALVVTDVLANAANGLATATQANPYVTKVAISSPTFLVSDLSDLIIELDVTTQGAGAYRLYGVDIHCQFNYN